jgi:hypothetical protein
VSADCRHEYVVVEAHPMSLSKVMCRVCDLTFESMWIERLIGDGCECPIGTPSRIPACDYCGYQNWLEDRD